MRFKTLHDWLRWQEGAHPNAIDLGLSRVCQVAETLGVLTAPATVITVAGTNGKGSCIATLSKLLGVAGKTFGAYTSPHILKYNERVSVNGVPASDEDLCAAFHAIDQARGDISLTYFEFGTLAAMVLFAEYRVDYWLLEVGLGGRLDATNIRDADVCIISSVDIDHVEWLGDNRESIGFEKAGICRNATPLVCADFNPPQSVLDTAARLDCPLSLISKDFGFERLDATYRFWGPDYSYNIVRPSLPLASIAASLQAMSLLGFASNGNETAQKEIALALNQLSLPGRLQVIQCGQKTVILDVAHNPAAMIHLATQLQLNYPLQSFSIVLAMMQDKNIADSVRALSSVAADWCVTCIEGLARSAQASHILEFTRNLSSDVPSCPYPNVAEALSAALAGDSCYILVTGSFYCVAEATDYLKANGDC